MKAIIFITVLFWGDAKPLKLEMLTDSDKCSTVLVKRYTEPLRVLEGWKMIISECEER